MITPASFCIFGSGRWAKVIASELFRIYEEMASFNFITERNSNVFSQELSSLGIKNFSIKKQFGENEIAQFAIVCGKARDNKKKVMQALCSGMHVFVEKPIALNLKDAEDMVNCAAERGLNFYPSNAFFLQHEIFELIRQRNKFPEKTIKKIEVEWHDYSRDSLNGNKIYDSSLTIFEDVLPHIVPIVQFLIKNETLSFEKLDIDRCGQDIKIELSSVNTFVKIKLSRNCDKKRRVISIHDDKRIDIDFSKRKCAQEYCRDNKISYMQKSFGPLTLSLFDFIKTSVNFSEQRREHVDASLSAIKLFPIMVEAYYTLCYQKLLSHSESDCCNYQDLEYFYTEFSSRHGVKNFDILRNRSFETLSSRELQSFCLKLATRLKQECPWISIN